MSLLHEIKKDFDYLQKMSIPESTLYRKWCELNKYEWSVTEKQLIWETQHSIWYPNKPEDYEKLEPGIIVVDDKNTGLIWTILRKFISTMPWKQNVGRMMRFIVIDKITKKYLGVLSLASDFSSLTPRDKYIGWTYKQRIEEKMLIYTAMGSTIVPTQPLGYNYTGGKLLTLLLCSDKVVNSWNKKYKEPLLGITTTSLYGGFSQYTGLKYWKKCGTSEGKIPLELSEDMYQEIRRWVKEKYPNDFKKITVNTTKILSRPKQRLLSFAYQKLKVKPPNNKAPRGVYFCKLYKETNDFLSKKVKNISTPLFDNDINVLVKIWKERYAKRRIESLVNQGKNKNTILFYSDIIGMDWKTTKKKYLNEVGK